MLTVGLTGGIGSGKSTVSGYLVEQGAVLIDSDVLAREVVAVGTEGLAEVVEAFGAEVLDTEGGLDRAELARRVFGDDAARRRLEKIIHPRVRARAVEITEGAPADAVVVQDIPLLTEVGLAPTFDLVMVVEAPRTLRRDRLVGRGMTLEAADARINAQTTDEQRRRVADVVIDNSGSLEATAVAVATVWRDRLIPFEDNKRHRRSVQHEGPVRVVDYDPDWPRRYERIAARLRHILGDEVERIDHIGSTSVPGLPAKDIIDVQITVTDLAVADRFADRLTDAGFPRSSIRYDDPKPDAPDRAAWRKRFHGCADPANLCNIHVRAVGSAGWAFALSMRDFLREHPDERDAYADLKRSVADEATDLVDYIQRKTPWFDELAPRLSRWAAESDVLAHYR
ncbi:dephospho-CoA kinase [Stackebrandtia endophytica]|uniref:Dephospho-CoA kinase n=1 Tax=Stackebrandtia endophytica TaxID=1496996 RepID=A0A543B3Z6_9ACTN|nr:dephospho-CoA kinase [Stackebrandtia endophytica]TQL79561.1 dephospho-CoA kinase [Stackebrandtia endophytica]